MTTPFRSSRADWPDLAWKAWSDTCATLHLWTQVVGKIRLVQTPWTNHSWHVPLYATARGLGTSPIPYGGRAFEIDFDFVDHELGIRASDGGSLRLPLSARPVREFYRDVMEALRKLDLPVRIHTTPSEIADAVPFERDDVHRHYDPEYATRFWRTLVQVDRASPAPGCVRPPPPTRGSSASSCSLTTR